MSNKERESLEQLYLMLPIGKENAISRKELCSILRRSDRTVRRRIHALRSLRTVCSNTATGGYYRPTNEQEKKRFHNQQRAYIKEINQTIHPSEETKQINGQEALEI